MVAMLVEQPMNWRVEMGVEVMQVKCPKCGASPGWRCVDTGPVHAERTRRAEAAEAPDRERGV